MSISFLFQFNISGCSIKNANSTDLGQFSVISLKRKRKLCRIGRTTVAKYCFQVISLVTHETEHFSLCLLNICCCVIFLFKVWSAFLIWIVLTNLYYLFIFKGEKFCVLFIKVILPNLAFIVKVFFFFNLFFPDPAIFFLSGFTCFTVQQACSHCYSELR